LRQRRRCTEGENRHEDHGGGDRGPGADRSCDYSLRVHPGRQWHWMICSPSVW
jgi:hypothetical protein